jgi:hypothetical protein
MELKIDNVFHLLTKEQESLLLDIMDMDGYNVTTITFTYHESKADLGEYIEVAYTPIPRELDPPPYEDGRLVKVEGITGQFRVLQWGVVAITLEDKRIVVSNGHRRPGNSTLQHFMQVWPKGVELYYCDDAGRIERKWRGKA